MAVILGVDPGSHITGYGIISILNAKPVYVASGCIRLSKVDLAQRLNQIHKALTTLIQQYQPTHCTIEQVFMHRNANSALKLGQARGAAIVAMANHELPVAEYTPRQIKQSVVGYGGADKIQVQHMVASLLKLAGTPQADAADALAVALCHYYMSQGLLAIAKCT